MFSTASVSARFRFVLSFLVVAFLVSQGMQRIKANDINSVHLSMEGSIDPPGDRLDISVVLFPEVRNATIEVLGYLVGGDHNEEQTPVEAGVDTRNRNKNGDFRLAIQVLIDGRQAEPALDKQHGGKTYLKRIDRRVVVPFADLAVPNGKHKLGYEVRLIADGKLVDAVSTELGSVTVSDKVRKEMLSAVSAMVKEQRVRDLECFVWNRGRLVRKELHQKEIIQKPVWETKTVEVQIKGEYLREPLAAPTNNSRPSSKFVPERQRTVYFATNREMVKPTGTIDDCFGNTTVLATDKMTYGRCLVSIPVDHHRPGDIEQPGRKWWFWTEEADPEKHFVVQQFDASLGPAQFEKAIADDDVLVFVHGYNNTFKDVVLRSAQFQHDLEFPGRMVAFSWPSAGSLTDYKHDEDVAERSHAFLAVLLDQLLNRHVRTGSKGKVHVIAHSMGNRVLLKALHDLRASGKLTQNGPRLGQVVLAAADIDGTTYANVRSDLFASCERVTYYFASDDGALLASRLAHLDKPIGLVPVFDDKMETISADKLTSVFDHLGHSYVSESRSILTDIRLMLVRGLRAADRRPPLGPRMEDPNLFGSFYWTFLSEQ